VIALIAGRCATSTRSGAIDASVTCWGALWLCGVQARLGGNMERNFVLVLRLILVCGELDLLDRSMVLLLV